MSTLKEYFDQSFDNCVKFTNKRDYVSNDISTKLEYQGCLDFYSGVMFLALYFEKKGLGGNFFLNFLNELKKNWQKGLNIEGGKVVLPKIKSFDGEIKVENTIPFKLSVKFRGEFPIEYTELTFSQRVFIYCDSYIPANHLKELKENAKALGFNLIFRGTEYMKYMDTDNMPMAFISHDSNDKDKIARPLADNLSKMLCRVWYDEYSLNVGDKLRESIEKGLKECSKCILILTPEFFKNNGWTKTEFNSIFTREILEEKNLVLPIWAGVSKQEVYEYSPSLLNVIGLDWEKLGEQEVTRKIYNALINNDK